MAVIPQLRLPDDGGLVGVDGRGHLQGPVGEMECVVSGEQSGHTLHGPRELIEPYLSVMFHNNITASFRFDTIELSWTVSGSSIY